MSNIIVVGNSYEKLENLEQKVIKKYNKEKSQGRKYPGAYFWRGKGKWERFVKSNFLLDGVPINLRGMITAIKSDKEEIYIIGNDETKETTSLLDRQFKSYLKQEGKKLKFIHEGFGNYPLHNTLIKTRQAIGKDNQVFFLSGDTPLFDIDSYDFENTEDFDIIMNLNSKENINGEFLEKYPKEGVYPRHYPFGIKNNGKKFFSKESNGYILKLNDKTISTAQKFYGMRKGGMKEVGSYVIKNIFRKEITPDAITLLKGYINGTGWTLSTNFINRLANNLEELNVLATPKHTSPGNLEDVDSHIDYAFLKAAFEKDPKIYKHHEDVQEFKENHMQDLAKLNSFFKKENFAQYFNSFFDKINIESPITNKGDLKEGILEQYNISEQRLKDHNTMHREYLRQ